MNELKHSSMNNYRRDVILKKNIERKGTQPVNCIVCGDTVDVPYVFHYLEKNKIYTCSMCCFHWADVLFNDGNDTEKFFSHLVRLHPSIIAAFQKRGFLSDDEYRYYIENNIHKIKTEPEPEIKEKIKPLKSWFRKFLGRYGR